MKSTITTFVLSALLALLLACEGDPNFCRPLLRSPETGNCVCPEGTYFTPEADPMLCTPIDGGDDAGDDGGIDGGTDAPDEGGMDAADESRMDSSDPDVPCTERTWYRDDDGDGHGLAGFRMLACEMPAGHAPLDDDCDDTVATRFPGAPELCDAMDQDCDDVVDENALGIQRPATITSNGEQLRLLQRANLSATLLGAFYIQGGALWGQFVDSGGLLSGGRVQADGIARNFDAVRGPFLKSHVFYGVAATSTGFDSVTGVDDQLTLNRTPAPSTVFSGSVGRVQLMYFNVFYEDAGGLKSYVPAINPIPADGPITVTRDLVTSFDSVVSDTEILLLYTAISTSGAGSAHVARLASGQADITRTIAIGLASRDITW